MKGLYKDCVAIVIILYGIFFLTTEFIFYTLPYGLLYALILYFTICMLRVPPPQQYQIEAIIGDDLWMENENGDEGGTGFYLKTVAHRGAGLDAPENSLEAFRMVSSSF